MSFWKNPFGATEKGKGTTMDLTDKQKDRWEQINQAMMAQAQAAKSAGLSNISGISQSQAHSIGGVIGGGPTYAPISKHNNKTHVFTLTTIEHDGGFILECNGAKMIGTSLEEIWGKATAYLVAERLK